MNNHISYVVGFLFDPMMHRVVLIRKTKPKFQEGLYNGVGGKVEEGELAEDSMVREFWEETGVRVDAWREFAQTRGVNNDGNSFDITFFYQIVDWHTFSSVKTTTEEQVCSFSTTAILLREIPMLGNVSWMVSLALDCANGSYPPTKVVAEYGSKEFAIK